MSANLDAKNAAKSTAGSSKVGYGHPPKNFKFKPGQSGNPLGRPKGSLSFASELAEELSIVVRSNDTDERITNKRAVIKQLIAAARKNPQIGIALISLCTKLGRGQDADPRAAEDDAFAQKLAEREPETAVDANNRIAPASDENNDEHRQ
jgi:hypothetical protein